MDPLENPKVQRYLGEVSGFLKDASPEMRQEVLEGIEDHLRMAMARGDSDADQALRDLGRPELVAEAALGGHETAGVQPEERPLWTRTWYPVLTLLLLLLGGSAFGGPLGVLAGLIGLVFLWNSGDWRGWEKTLATIFLPLYGVVGMFLAVPESLSVLPLVFVGVSLVMVVYLGWVAGTRRRAPQAYAVA